MRRRARIDSNHREIVAALRDVGATVLDLSGVGNGAPDLLIGYRGCNLLLEVKRPDSGPVKAGLRPEQAAWHQRWAGHVTTVRTIADALAAVGAVERQSI